MFHDCLSTVMHETWTGTRELVHVPRLSVNRGCSLCSYPRLPSGDRVAVINQRFVPSSISLPKIILLLRLKSARGPEELKPCLGFNKQWLGFNKPRHCFISQWRSFNFIIHLQFFLLFPALFRTFRRSLHPYPRKVPANYLTITIQKIKTVSSLQKS